MKLEVTACDIDRAVPAQTYTIEVQDGRKVTKDLCASHAAPIEAMLAELGEAAPEREAAVRIEPAAKPAPRKRAPAKKAAAKKTAARRRPNITSLAEIEASKKKT
ncbi:hypothetical protein ACFXOY_17945 [Streptomyces niveus]|uniref:hypothetical protein n=1 Tax=Streptomyces niveus TaxID=193462 RepID=UPI0036C7F342